MIYEVRTYRLKTGMVNATNKAFAEGYEDRKKFSELSAYFYTDVGPLNQIIHIWPYKDLAERTAIRGEAAKLPSWPPKITEYLEEQQAEIFHPFPFIQEFRTGKMGPLFEWREYTLGPGRLPVLIEAWSKAFEKRETFSKAAMVMHTELGGLNKFVHIWPYESFEHRADVRARSRAEGTGWPAKTPPGTILKQENKLLFAAPFSPLQ